MRKLQALVRHILTETGISRENVAAFLDQGAVMLTGRNLGHGVEGCVLKYDGVIDIERSDYDGIALLALVSGWLQSHDPDRDGLEDPEVNAAVNDLSTTRWNFRSGSKSSRMTPGRSRSPGSAGAWLLSRSTWPSAWTA